MGQERIYEILAHLHQSHASAAMYSKEMTTDLFWRWL